MNQFYSRLFNLSTLTVLLILLGACRQLSAQGITTEATKNRITGLLTDERSRPIAFGLISLISVIDRSTIKESLTDEKGLYTIVGVPAGNYLIRASAFGSFEETSSSSFLITKELNSMAVPDIKMARRMDQNFTPVKYWQTGWFVPFSDSDEPIQKDSIKNYTPEKYWQADWWISQFR